jgi:hypothetical protein
MCWHFLKKVLLYVLAFLFLLALVSHNNPLKYYYPSFTEEKCKEKKKTEEIICLNHAPNIMKREGYPWQSMLF